MFIRLFQLYLYLRKHLPHFAISTLVITIINNHHHFKTNDGNTAWQVQHVVDGDRLVVSNQTLTKTINLCGIASTDSFYLASLINKGDRSIELQQSGSGYEAWVMLAPDYESQIHLNTEMVMAGKATLEDHTTCISAENLELASSYED